MKLDLNTYRVAQKKNVDLAKYATYDTQGWSEADMWDRIEKTQTINAKLQEKLYAENTRSILLVFQAMDAGGKDSTIKTLCKQVNPAGVTVASFKEPTTHEKDRDFLWRIHDKVPEKGNIGIFNRSHYEDVIIARVRELASSEEIEKRYDDINNFERYLFHQNVHIIKFLLHISPEYQFKRFQHRLSNPQKWWKFSEQDLEERKLWTTYMEAFEIALSKCSKKNAPWYIIPAESKAFRCMVVGEILRNKLESLNPQYPTPSFDPAIYNEENLHLYA